MIDHNPIIWDHQAVVIVNPSEMQNWMTFISPLQYESWAVVGMAIMVCGIALTLSGHILEGNENGILSYLISIANLMIFFRQ